MVDGLLKVALAGTARAGVLPEGATPADALVPTDGDGGVERRVLLMAGARAAYRQAGVSARAMPGVATASDETLASCSVGAGRLIGTLLTGAQADILPEALGRLRLAGLRLPYALLPGALEAGSRKSDLRPALLETIGERGRWLAGQHQPWRWATARPLADDDTLPADAEAVWQEGLPSERLAILRLLRAHDPARARKWLADAWKGEKAEFRGDAIGALAAGLSPEDEPFLETALDDRSQTVRAEAATLLVRLPESALARRLRERAERFLVFTPGLLAGGWRAAAKALVKGSSGGKLTATLPERYDKAWARDGITEKPPHGIGERAWWLVQHLAGVHPAHWERRFGVAAQELIDAAVVGEWGETLLEGWAQAAITFGDAEWAVRIWGWWLHQRPNEHYRRIIRPLREAPVGSLAEDDLRAIIGRLVPRGNDPRNPAWLTILGIPPALPRTLDTGFGRRYLEALEQRLQRLPDDHQNQQDPWLHSLAGAALSLPLECLGRTGIPWTFQLPDNAPWQLRTWQRQIEQFNETVEFRQRLREEIPL